jgi:hypothetical protein
MAGDWMPVRLDLWDDPRIVRLDRALNCGRATAVGACVRLWAVADNYSQDGALPGYDAATVDATVGLNGFALAMEAIGWLTINSDGVVIPDFDRWNGRGAKRRLKDNRRKAADRKVSARDADKTRTKRGPQNRTEQESTEQVLNLGCISLDECARDAKKIAAVAAPRSSVDRELILRVCILKQLGKLSENAVWDSVEGTRTAGKGNRIAYWRTCLAGLLPQDELRRLLGSVRPPPEFFSVFDDHLPRMMEA